jgi:beta-mannanase
MLHISTTVGASGPQATTPGAIARGDGDAYLVELSSLIKQYGKPVYVRLFPEMDNAHNAYAAVNLDGSSRGPDYSPSAFVAAWRRVVIVLRGGPVASIDTRLEALGQPPLHGLPASATISSPPVSFVWCPQVAGLPAVAGNSPADYYPGNAYVDWVGTDFYSQFPNFAGLDALYKEFPNKPFAFGEWAIWGGDNPAFVDEFFQWINAHKRVQMMLYNWGYTASGPLSLNLDPASSAAIHQQYENPRYLASLPQA